jgi:F-type H+-transporting ATPase subunit delta
MTINRQAKREAKQLFRFCVMNGLLDESRARQVAQRVAAAGYRDCPAILAQFVRLVRLDCTRHTASVESAAPLPLALKSATQAELTHLYGPGLTTNFVERPSLIGGMRIQVGSDVYDGSVRGVLAALEKSF